MPSFKWRAPGCPCCSDCLILEDFFNRTSVGANWAVDSGTWSVNGEELREESGSGLIVTDAEHHDETMLAAVDILDLISGDTYKLIVDYKDTGSSYYYGKYYWDGGDFAELTVGFHSGGADDDYETVQITPPDPGDDDRRYFTLRVCRSTEGIAAWADDGHASWTGGITDNGGRKAGLFADGSVSARDLAFDNFWWSEHWHTNEECPACPCDCDDFAMPHQLVMTFAVISCDMCTDLDGATATSDYLHEFSDKQYRFNFASIPVDLVAGCYEGTNIQFFLNCPTGCLPESSDSCCDEWELVNQYWHHASEHAATECEWDEYSLGISTAFACVCTCDPIYFEFGPFSLTTEDGQCTYKIIITAAP